jgi:hypothetical protein
MQPRVIRQRGGMIAILALTASAVRAVPLCAQAPTGDSSPVTLPYRAPQLALAEPVGGAGLPQDNPSVVFRFAQGETDDPLDLATFEVAIDGAGRTTQFRVDSTTAWGSLDPPPTDPSAPHDHALALGIHQLAARICSARAICTDTRATVTVIGPSTGTGDTTAPAKRRSALVAVIVLILSLIRKLITR